LEDITMYLFNQRVSVRGREGELKADTYTPCPYCGMDIRGSLYFNDIDADGSWQNVEVNCRVCKEPIFLTVAPRKRCTVKGCPYHAIGQCANCDGDRCEDHSSYSHEAGERFCSHDDHFKWYWWRTPCEKYLQENSQVIVWGKV
jgi:hypothetical protein